MGILIGMFALAGILTAGVIFGRRMIRKKYYDSLPKTLKDGDNKYIVNKKLLKRIYHKESDLIITAKSKFMKDRQPHRILNESGAHSFIEKYVRVYFDDFTDEISDRELDWNNENTKLFFGLMEHKYGITNKSLLISVLYLREELEYFTYRDSMLLHKPENLGELFKQTVRYTMINEKVDLQHHDLLRASVELGFGLPWGKVNYHLQKAKKAMELEQFEKDFVKSDHRVTETAAKRMARTTWEQLLKLAGSEGIDISEDSYVVAPSDHSRESRIDRFFKNHLKFALFQHFNWECADCDVMYELELDHFWIPKSKGGNFAMRSKAGVYVNNCIPLCRSCNASKGAKNVYEYFEADKVKELLAQSHKFGPFLNSHLQGFEDPHFNGFGTPATTQESQIPVESEGKKAA